MRYKRAMKKSSCFLIALVLLNAPMAGYSQEATEVDVRVLEVLVDAAPDQVYPFLTDEDRIARWQNDDGVTVTFPRGTETRVGKQVKVEIHAPTNPWILLEIVGLETDRKVTTEIIDGVLSGSFSYRLEPTADGGTRVVHEMRIRPVGSMMTVFWGIFGRPLHEHKMRRLLDAMKDVVEQEVATNPSARRPSASDVALTAYSDRFGPI